MSQSLLNALKFLVFVGLGFGILYLVYRNQQAAYAADCALRGIAGEECSLLDKVLRDFRGANFWWLGMTLVAFCISNVSRAIRWNMLLRTLGKSPRFINAFLTINLGYLANLGFPRFGEIVRPAAMARYEGIKLERVVGTVVVDRMVDVICLLTLTGLTLLMAGDRIWAWVDENASVSDRLAGLEWLLTSAVILTVGGLALAWFQRRRIMATRLGGKLVTIVRGFGEGIRTIATVERPGRFILHSLNIWLMYFLMTYFVFLSFGPTAGLGPEAALTTFVSGGWGIVVPSPGGMGSYHYMAQSALGLYGVPGEDGFSWANISFFSINIGCNVLIGLLALLLLPRINRSYTPT
ncbi:lysylphosphatidylglycerol synthase transmembrane domain-containing protein [Lewinella sp. JB7]|uniref:lysylphosphatidylglycerol synthase transmembrane domain-containing protein n=1 Tax=Lewinella sp. JB7 TaxID=2962887 RepID=UPI0020C96D5F|nr:lysylphosphatidylglycerol synthase transmembrane domain-containing protein [Lewinella sp. JB7]MCP9236440.1 flippase-like domain-containing protein [Lewinella sp. JB7]